jgi:hypothetical protein
VGGGYVYAGSSFGENRRDRSAIQGVVTTFTTAVVYSIAVDPASGNITSDGAGNFLLSYDSTGFVDQPGFRRR